MKNNSFFKTIVPYVIIFWLLIGIVCFFPSWFISETILRKDFSQSGQIGDTIGGIMGPFIATIGAFVTFIAFWVQYDANRNQRRDIQIERFENNFYELLQMNRENVSEMRLSPYYQGRKIFPKLFLELKYVFHHVSNLVHKYPNKEVDISLNYKFDIPTIYNISYLIYYWGIGENAEKILIPNLRKYASMDFINYITKPLNALKNKIRDYQQDSKGKPYIEPYVLTINVENGSMIDHNEGKFYYVPFDGHAHRLGHYYRHLFQLVKLVSTQPDSLFDETQKYNYIKTLRAQLTSFEQLMLYYNSISPLGDAWNISENDFIGKYRLIKNIPVPLAMFAMSPKEKYKNWIAKYKNEGEEFFEWDEGE